MGAMVETIIPDDELAESNPEIFPGCGARHYSETVTSILLNTVVGVLVKLTPVLSIRL